MNRFGRSMIVILIIAIICLVTIPIFGCIPEVDIPNEHYENADATLINPNASSDAKKLMAFLKEQYGKMVLSGQYVNEYEDFSALRFRVDSADKNSPMTVMRANEMQAVHKVTGDYPVIAGFDVSIVLIDGTNYSVQQAIEWHRAGGIVTFCWHWLVNNFDGKEREFYTEKTAFSLKNALADKNSPQYQGMIADIDKISAYLQELKENRVPVLWRPLHEASGGWFWWGADGAEAYKELWDIVYERMAVYHGLNNLIWVTNPQDAAWYVGDDKCDLVGDDPYYDYSKRKYYLKDKANRKRFKKAYAYASNKMIAMSENDYIPDMDTVFVENVKWLFFVTWCREFVCEYLPDEQGNRFTCPNYVEMCTTKEELIKVYQDERVWTLNKLRKSGYYDTTQELGAI